MSNSGARDHNSNKVVPSEKGDDYWLSFFFTSVSNFHYELAGMHEIYKFIKTLVLSLDEPVLTFIEIFFIYVSF